MKNLTGTEKQISWAKSIRTELSENFTAEKATEYVAEEIEDGLMDDGDFDFGKLEIFIEAIKTETTAKWFIDNRNVTFFTFED